jgi:glycosyltransferase involved in cell wall biosynthesis
MSEVMQNGHVIVRYEKPSPWKSCNFIEELLVSEFDEPRFWIQDREELLPQDTRTLIISDHRWIGKKKLALLRKHPRLQIFFYLYGDFTLRLGDFNEHMDALKTHDVNLVVASESQKRLVSNIYPEYAELLIVRPYPFDQKKFSFDLKLRESFREKYILGNDEIYGFCGRLSRQKGVLELMASFLKNTGRDASLILAGPLRPHPFWQFSAEEDPGFVSEFHKLTKLGGKRITWIQELPHEDMPAFYSAIDTYISLSYFHDEDFNLTLSEALAAGRKCVVTAWGGHFRCADNSAVNFVPMDLSGNFVRPNTRKLESYFAGEELPDQRGRMELIGLTDAERKYVRRNPHFLRAQDNSFNRDLYYKIYSSYL